MSVSALVTAVLLGQSAFSLALDREPEVRTDVAYHELSTGQVQAALSKLEATGGARSSDPAVLINLGAAYARAGKIDRALVAYRAAAVSSDRFDLELADGTWRDSRDVARNALRNLLAASSIAAR